MVRTLDIHCSIHLAVVGNHWRPLTSPLEIHLSVLSCDHSPGNTGAITPALPEAFRERSAFVAVLVIRVVVVVVVVVVFTLRFILSTESKAEYILPPVRICMRRAAVFA